MKTWQQRHDEEQARRAEVEETLAQVRRQAASPTSCAICGNRGPILPDGWCVACDQIVDDIDAHPHRPAPAPAPAEPDPAPVVCWYDADGEHPADPESMPCCSSHDRPMCRHHYRWSHFVETGFCCDDCEAKGLVSGRPRRTPAPAPVEPEPAPVVDLVERIIEIPLAVASQPPAAERCACGHKGISHPRWGKCNRLACGCGSFRGCA